VSYEDLLVHLDDSKGCARRVDAAVGLAARHGAHLAGVYPMVEIPLLNYIRNQIPPDIQASMAAEAQARAEAALNSFRTAVERRPAFPTSPASTMRSTRPSRAC
jgi:nucleotide-binding universal stress UspA family protein